MSNTLIGEVIAMETAALQALAEQLGGEIEACVSLLAGTRGNILVAGMGTSGAVARRAAHLLACCGAPAFYVHPSDQQHGASGAVREGDTILVFSKGGESEEINTFLRMVREKGCKVVALTGREQSSMTPLVDKQIVFTTPQESEPFGMIATTSSLASCLVTDVLCHLYLRQTGYTQERFAQSHPGGAVGQMVREVEDE